MSHSEGTEILWTALALVCQINDCLRIGKNISNSVMKLHERATDTNRRIPAKAVGMHSSEYSGVKNRAFP